LGLDLEIKNARSHSPLDLTSNPKIKSLITNTLNEKKCQNCALVTFDFSNHRYVCSICLKVICKQCCKYDFYFVDNNSTDKDLLSCRCLSCYNEIIHHENILREALKSNSLEKNIEVINVIKSKNIKICLKLLYESNKEIARLETESKINSYVNSLKVVTDHKTISKSLYVLEEMIKESKDNNINLDLGILDLVNCDKKRLVAEKELRSLLLNLTLDMSTPENLLLLQDKLLKAQETQVEKQYLETGEELSKKLN